MGTSDHPSVHVTANGWTFVGARTRPSRFPSAPVAQLDRAPDYESGGREFESSPVRQSREIIRLMANRSSPLRSLARVGPCDQHEPAPPPPRQAGAL